MALSENFISLARFLIVKPLTSRSSQNILPAASAIISSCLSEIVSVVICYFLFGFETNCIIEFSFLKTATPNQITEAVIAIAPINTKAGGKPKYTSVNIPIGINTSKC
jgi:hypothetical protein